MRGGALLLAAGRSRRFGSDKRLHVIEQMPMLAQTIFKFQSIFEHLVVVVRSDDTAVTAMLQKHKLTPELVIATKADLGMGHTLAAGVQHIQSWDYVFLGLADMPFIKPRSLQTLQTSLTDSTQIVQPTYQGVSGHPVGFGSQYFSELMALTGDSGARSVVDLHKDQVITLEIEDAGLTLDVDTEVL